MSEKKKGKQGFASNPAGINRGGRPKGSRNKSSLMKAQLQLDSASEQAAEFYQAVMNNDTESLGITEDVPMNLRLQAAKEIMNKAIANENKKEETEASRDSEEENVMPLFSSVPVAGND